MNSEKRPPCGHTEAENMIHERIENPRKNIVAHLPNT